MQYMLLFRGLAANPQATDQRTADYNRQWGQWMADLAKSHALLAGAPFHASGKVITGAEVADLELEPVDTGGFAMIEVDSEQAALEIAKTAPHAALGGTTIVRPVVAVGG